MKQLKATFILVFLLLSLGPFVGAQSKPNVSGTWKMNAEKSKFERSGPTAITIKFDHQGSTLEETLTLGLGQSERTNSFKYALDGKESLQQMQGQSIKTSAKWDGDSLVIEFKNDAGQSLLRKFTMSADGKTMTIDVKQTTPNGSANDIVLLEKQ